MSKKIEYKYFLKEMMTTDSFLKGQIKKIIADTPHSKVLVYSVFQSKKELSFLEKKNRQLHEITRFIHGQRKLLQPKIPKEKGVYRIFYTAENSLVNMNYCDYAFGFGRTSEVNHPNYKRLPNYVKFGIEGMTSNDRQQYIQSLPEKHEFCDFVYSHKVKYRENLFDLVNEYRAVTAPGASKNNAEAIGKAKSTKESRKHVDWAQERINYSKRFKFSIACENECYPGYITEKIVFAFKAGAIPIYYGAPDISQDFNPKAFINANILSKRELIEKIQYLYQNDEARLEMLKHPPIINKEIIEYYI